MAKTKGPFKAAGKSAQSVAAPIDKGKAPATNTGVNDQLRQAVLDLGGDEEDLALIAGVDDDAEGVYTGAPGLAMKSTEKEIKKALGDFMKGLDFKAAGADRPAEEDEDEDEEEEGDSEEDDDEDDEEDDEEEDEEEEEEPAPIAPLPKAKAAPEPRKPVLSASVIPSTSTTAADPDPTSATEVPPTPIWPTLLPPLPTSSTPTPALPQFKLQGLRSKAETLLGALPPLKRKSSSADAAFISQVLTSGTHQDKLAALTLLVRESPIHAVKELGRLRGMTGYKEDTAAAEGRVGAGAGGNKDQRVAVCKALVDWWVSGGGKASGKLRYFADQPQLGHADLTDRHLLVFAFEDFLKRWFFNLLQVLEVLAHDPLVYIRTQALQMVFRLLQGNAEQEQNLLRLGANKLGDTDKAVASKTSHLILTLLQVHPAMKAIIAREVSSLVLKPTAPTSTAAAPGTHIKFDDAPAKPKPKGKAGPAEKSDAQSHARYYGLITLNQITLARGDLELAGRLVDLYFEIFREILGDERVKKDEEGGVAGIEQVVGKVGKWEGRRKNGGKGKKGDKDEKKDGEDLEAADARLIAAVLTGINRAVPYAKLDDAVFTGYMQSLFKITHLGTFNTSVQSLSLIFQVTQSAQSKPSSEPSSSSAQVNPVTDRFYRTLYDSLFDPRLLTSSKQAMYLNLLFRAIKADKEMNRVMAFVKRLCQMFGSAGVPFLSGALYLLGELFSTTPGLKRMLIEPEDDGEERFVDAPEAGQEAKKAEVEHKSIHLDDGYDGKKREPLYAKAETSCLWEILPLTTHFHPSISLLSTQLLLSAPLSGSPDIGQNTLISFLDKFVYRNPKKNVAQKGASVMQPAAADRSGAIGGVKNQKGVQGSGTVNSEAFWRKKVEDVPVDQLFFHKFFSAKLAQKDADKRRSKKKEGSEVDDVAESGDEAGSEIDEDEVWKAMQASMPGADDLAITDSEGDDDEDVDVDYSSDEEEVEGEDADAESASGSGSGSDIDVGEMGSDEEVDIDDDDDEEVDVDDSDEEEEEAEGDNDDNDGFPDLDSEEDDLIPLDEMPDIVLDGSPSPEPEEEEEQEEAGTKRKRDNKERKELRKKRKEMPVFGDYEEWQKVIEQGGNEGED